MNHSEKMKRFQEKKRHQLAMGGEEKLKARKGEGKLNARERIDCLFDPGTFMELGLFAHSALPGMADRTPADGKITGYGLVEGRPVGAVANDMTVMGASSSLTNMKKIEHMRSISCEKGMPLVFLGESTGARIPDVMGSQGMAQGGQNTDQYRRLRESPWISVLLGPSYGSSTWYSAMSDISIMLKGAVMAVSSPKVTSLAISEELSPEELGGWKLHSEVTGLVDAVGETEGECIHMTKRYLSYLPSHAQECPPREEVPRESGRDMPHILDILPENPKRAYDMKNIVKTLVDGGQFLELKAHFGRPCITAFARLDGHAIGIIANNPLFGAGALDAECCEKITSFLVLCDSFQYPHCHFGRYAGLSGRQRRRAAENNRKDHQLDERPFLGDGAETHGGDSEDLRSGLSQHGRRQVLRCLCGLAHRGDQLHGPGACGQRGVRREKRG